ncbi:MAG: leucyl aminopeptidase family protein [Planctomycetes bacterium]|nr:leucyl aminopeptidase family protein [Planctomycetota bacterium]
MRMTCMSRPPARVQALIRLVADADRLDDLPPPLRAALAERLRQGPVAILPSLGLHGQPMVGAVRNPTWDDAVETRRRGGSLGRALVAERCGILALELPAGLPVAAVEAFLVGIGQGIYAWDRYQPTPVHRPTELVLLSADAAVQAAVRRVEGIAPWIARCRDLTNLPAQDMGPDEFEAEARAVAKAAGLRLRVLDERACTRLGMGCLLAVGRASPRRPRMLVLELRGREREQPLALCGKGVCFDTGGLDIKGAEGMLLMRKDMGGAAAVLCALAAAAAHGRPRQTVRAYLPLVENAISGDAYRPGDVLRAMDGTTVEVGNTDAEGRLILADAVALARKDGAGRIISVGTLTGAAMTALGRIHVPVMGTDDGLVGAVLQAARATGEKAWPLPMDHEHRAMLRGQVAQLNNSPGGEAGCITAGAFIAHFAGDTPFAHLDISPSSWMPRPWDLGPAGATGTIVTTLARLACG